MSLAVARQLNICHLAVKTSGLGCDRAGCSACCNCSLSLSSACNAGPAPGQHGTQQQQQQQRPHSSKPAIEQPASSSGHPDTQEAHELEASAQSTFGWLVSFLPGSASFRATGSRKGQGTGAVDVRVSTPPAAGQSQTDASGRGSRQGSKDMENADRSDSIGEYVQLACLFIGLGVAQD